LRTRRRLFWRIRFLADFVFANRSSRPRTMGANLPILPAGGHAVQGRRAANARGMTLRLRADTTAASALRSRFDCGRSPSAIRPPLSAVNRSSR
jgi:hypothetical protein